MKNILLERYDEFHYALVVRLKDDSSVYDYVAAYDYQSDGTWGQGHYFENLNGALNHIEEKFVEYKKEVLRKVKVDAFALFAASDKLRDDKDFMLEASRINPDALWFSTERLRDDKDFMLKAIKINPKLIRIADDELLDYIERQQLESGDKQIEKQLKE